LISKRISLKKRKAPPSTQDVYTEATQLAHIKNPIKPKGTHKKTPNKHNRNLHKTKEPPIVTPEYKKNPKSTQTNPKNPLTRPPKPKRKKKT
jgi:hypothetical protein